MLPVQIAVHDDDPSFMGAKFDKNAAKFVREADKNDPLDGLPANFQNANMNSIFLNLSNLHSLVNKFAQNEAND